MAAAAFGESKLIRILLEAGANPTRRATGGPHKGANAKDLAKNLSGKPTAQKRCIELIEGTAGRCPTLLALSSQRAAPGAYSPLLRVQVPSKSGGRKRRQAPSEREGH